MNGLLLTYTPEDRWHGALEATAEVFGFGGHASAWFNVEHLSDFARALAVFPLERNENPTLAGGISEGGVLEDVHLRLRIAPASRAGILVAEIDLVADRDVSASVHRQRCSLRLPVEQAALDRFQTEMMAMIEAGGQAALLGLVR